MSVRSCCLVSHTLQEGVGPADANRLLAAEFLQRGYRVSLCGINDPNVATVREEEIKIWQVMVKALHIPQAMSWEARAEVFRSFVEKEQAEWVVFRFIPYSLNPKGIVKSAADSLPGILLGMNVIWLVDEIWLGEGPATLKHRLVGLLQRSCILRLLKDSKPKRVFTNNRFNTKILLQKGVAAGTLRLFGNIPVVTSDLGKWLFREFAKAHIPITAANREQWLLLGNFGVFHSDWEPASFYSKLRDQARQHGKQVCVIGIGSLRSYEEHWESVSKKWSGDFRFLHLDRRTDVEISQFLQSVDYGLTTNPYYLVGKSGTCMAMLDHGLPILVPRITGYDDPSEFPADLVLRCGNQVDGAIFQAGTSRTPDPELPRAVQTLIGTMPSA